IATEAKGEVSQRLPQDDEAISVFLPTTPNPTSGFLLFVPRHEILMLDMTVEDAAKLVISAGLITPEWPRPGAKTPARAPGAAAPVPVTGRLSDETSPGRVSAQERAPGSS
ncbi:MAG: hypothetical protein AAFW98_12970, partial [Pseudomonadota bacterium]